MELMTQADRVVREHLPQVLEAAGEQLSARSLRSLRPLEDAADVAAAVSVLGEIRALGATDSEWESVVEEASFWCEAAVLAAVRGDASAFRHHVGKADAAMRDGLHLVLVH